jgi:lipopolysaccharide transport system permease protein
VYQADGSSSIADVSAASESLRDRSRALDTDRDDDDVLTVIVPRGRWPGFRLRELWEYRELTGFLIWRDIKVRYKQTALGAAWAVLQPALTMVVFSVFFGRLAKIPSDGAPYPIFSFAGLVPWSLFSFGLTQATNSVVGSQHLVTKVFFPRLAIPLAAVSSGVLDFAIALAVLFGMMLAYGLTPTAHIVWVPVFAAIAFFAALGAGFWLAALNVQYRDVRYVLPFLTQLWLFATPIAYPASLLHEPWRTFYGLNPMTGVVEGFRWALLGTSSAPTGTALLSTAVAALLLVSGAMYFQHMERTFADVV